MFKTYITGIGVVILSLLAITLFLYPQKDPSHALKRELLKNNPSLDTPFLQAQECVENNETLLNQSSLR